MVLDEYQQKRNFSRTPEPAGGEAAGPGGDSFVIQRHAARRLHYDFRLELDGVLKSWAVPKGLSLDPEVKSLAVHVEDHPLEYGGFEGVIPAGEYGGGTVMLFDRGRWEPLEDPRAGYRRGRLKFRLHGQRLQGSWNLVRAGGRAAKGQDQWLLIKRKDRFAQSGDGHAYVDQFDRSVTTDRTMDEIAGQAGRVWSSQGPASAEQGGEAAAAATTDLRLQDLAGARRRPIPDQLSPQLPTLVDSPPEGDDWLHELKFDGYRLIGIKTGDSVRLLTRRGLDWSDRFPTVAAALGRLPRQELIVDGEVVVLTPEGRSDFQALQNSLAAGRAKDHVCYLFDLLYCDGYDLTQVRLDARKQFLADILRSAGDSAVLRYSDHIRGQGRDMYLHACRYAVEGVVSKRADSRYSFRRSKSWLKAKCRQRQEFVVGGFTRPEGARQHFGSLLLGYYDGDRLVYCGRVGSGFSGASLADIAAELLAREIDRSPFAVRPPGSLRGIRWVRPELVVEVEFAEWTGEGILRQATFQGLREDKDPRQVGRELPGGTSALGNSPSGSSPSGTSSSGGASSRRRKPVASADDRPTAKGDLPATNGRSPATASRRSADAARVAGIRISNPDKPLYPGAGVTKLDLARYYEQISDWILPYLIDRPLSIVRCPHGWESKCFFQKHISEGLSAPIRSIPIDEADGREQYIGVSDREGLVMLAQLGVLEIHPWGSRADRPDRPDRMIFDLDPGEGVSWEAVVEAAHLLRQRLAQLDLVSFVRTTGGKGLHVVVPLDRRSDWAEVKAFSRSVATRFARRWPDRFIATATKAKRQGKIYVDYLRNSRGATAVSSYSTRARAGATVATPLGWDELQPALRSDHFNVHNLPERLEKLPRDPWQELFTTRQSLTRQRLRAAGAA